MVSWLGLFVINSGRGAGRGVKNFEERFLCKVTLGESSPLKRLGLLVTCYLLL